MLSGTSALATEKVTNIDEEKEVILVQNVEEKDLSKLFLKAKFETDLKGKDEVIKDSKGNIVYKTSQTLKKSKNKKGEIDEKVAVTTFSKIDIPSNDITPLTNNITSLTLSSSKGDGKWDSSYSAYLYSTVYYTKLTYNNKSCAKMDYSTGGVSDLNSGVQVQSMLVRIGQVSAYWPSTTSQVKETYYYGGTFTIYPNSNWIPVPDTFGLYGSILGCTMEVTLGRSSRTWSETFTNNL